MTELTKEQKIEVLNSMLEKLKRGEYLVPSLKRNYMCIYIDLYFNEFSPDTIEVFPEFKRPKNAKTYDGSSAWFDGNDFKNRIAYIENLLTKLQ